MIALSTLQHDLCRISQSIVCRIHFISDGTNRELHLLRKLCRKYARLLLDISDQAQGIVS